MYGYNNLSESVYIRFQPGSTYIHDMKEEVTQDMIDYYWGLLNPDDVKRSKYNPNLIIARNPILVDETKVKIVKIDDEGNETSVDLDRTINYSRSRYNPQGCLAAFWEYNKIEPYGWFKVSNLIPIERKYTYSRHEYTSDEAFIKVLTQEEKNNIDVPHLTSKFFWDIETYSSTGNFSDSTNVDDYITVISVVTVVDGLAKAYVLSWMDYNEDLMKTPDMETEVIIVKSEAEVIDIFFSLWIQTNPIKVIQYNGDKFDLPYLINRAEINNVELPPLTVIKGLKSVVKTTRVPTPIGRQMVPIIVTPGVETIDLVHYARRFIPGLNAYTLDNVAYNKLGRGKTGMSISKMFDIIRTRDRDLMADVFWYSVIDSILLYELWTELDLEIVMENLCNNIGCTMEELGRFSDKHIISRLAYMADPGTAVTKMNYRPIPYYNNMIPGFHINVTAVNYDDYTTAVLDSIIKGLETKDLHYIDVWNRTKLLPSRLSNIVYCSDLMPSYILETIMEGLQELSSEVLIIGIDADYIYIRGKLPEYGYLKVVDTMRGVLSIGNCKISVISEDEIVRNGISSVCRPKFDYIRKIVDEALKGMLKGQPYVATSNINLNVNELLYTSNVKPSSVYKSTNSKEYILSKKMESLGMNIKTWITVKYLVTKQGAYPIMSEDDYKLVPEIDLLHYGMEIKDVTNYLESIVIHQ